MDLPWNPAVVEQRIGRVHRMGQSRGAQVFNFVGQGSIEEGMLSVLAFKTSLFAGVLDGGASEVFLQGTKLSQFMKSVEQVAGAMGEAEAAAEAAAPAAGTAPRAIEPEWAAAPDGPVAAAGPADAAVLADEAAVGAASAQATDPWTAILEAGAALLQGMAATRAAGAPGAAPFAIERDPATGQASVHIPLPDPAVLKRLAQAFEPWPK
jgi:hypothetical protein